MNKEKRDAGQDELNKTGLDLHYNVAFNLM